MFFFLGAALYDLPRGHATNHHRPSEVKKYTIHDMMKEWHKIAFLGIVLQNSRAAEMELNEVVRRGELMEVGRVEVSVLQI